MTPLDVLVTQLEGRERELLREVERLRMELEEAKASAAACIDFMDHEMQWEYFREEMLYFDRPEAKSISLKNADKLQKFLRHKEHGKDLLAELQRLRERVA